MYLIDGYNLLHAPGAPWGVTARRALPQAVRALADSVDAFCERRKTQATLVFDGNPPPQAPGSTPRVRIRFTGKERSADEILSDLAAGTSDRAARRTTIVSSDRAVAAQARAQTCGVLTSEEFLGLATERKRPGRPGPGRNHALSPHEVETWLDKFGFR